MLFASVASNISTIKEKPGVPARFPSDYPNGEVKLIRLTFRKRFARRICKEKEDDSWKQDVDGKWNIKQAVKDAEAIGIGDVDKHRDEVERRHGCGGECVDEERNKRVLIVLGALSSTDVL